LREHSQAAIHYKPYSPNTPLIQPTIGGGLTVNETRPVLVLASTSAAFFGTFLITDCCITPNMCPVMIASGSVGGCVCLTCTAYHVADCYYQKNPFCLEAQNRQQNPPERILGLGLAVIVVVSEGMKKVESCLQVSIGANNLPLENILLKQSRMNNRELQLIPEQ
jgi:hypothetical protein